MAQVPLAQHPQVGFLAGAHAVEQSPDHVLAGELDGSRVGAILGARAKKKGSSNIPPDSPPANPSLDWQEGMSATDPSGLEVRRRWLFRLGQPQRWRW